MSDSETLDHLLSSPLVPLRPDWTVPERVTQLAELRDLGTDEYWEWVAAQQRWLEPWSTVRSGELGDFRYFSGGRINVADNCVDRWAEDPATADRVAIVWEGEPGDTRSLTYAELRNEVSALAAGLAQLGVQEGDVVGIYLPNLVEAFTAIHACNRLGAIYTVLFSGFGEEAVASRLLTARAKVVIVADAVYRRGKPIPLLQTLRAARPRIPTLLATVVVDRTGDLAAGSAGPLEENEIAYAEVVANGQGGLAPLPLDPNAPSFLIFTSGTESRPKGVVHSVGGFLLGTWANAHWQVGYEPGDVYWVAADVGWLTFPIQAVVGGLACGMTIACYEGALDTPTPARFYEICERHRVTKVLAAPTLWRMLRKFGDGLAAEHPLSLKLITMQGEPLDVDTFTWTTTTFDAPVVNAYGQTETGSTWAYPVYGVEPIKAGSLGTAVPGHEFAILDDAGEPVPPGTKGNLVLTAPFPTLCRTVWDDAGRYTSAYFSRFPGVYATNDEAVLDPDGHLWVLGRVDDVINVAAHRISTMEIEGALTAHPAVVEAAVVGVPDPTKGTVPVAFVTLANGVDADSAREQLATHVVGEMGGYARPATIFVTPTLPKTRTGKTMRRLLRDLVVHGKPTGDTSAMEDPAALDVVAGVVRAAHDGSASGNGA